MLQIIQKILVSHLFETLTELLHVMEQRIFFRFRNLVRNIRQRRGEKVAINVPIYKDINTPNPYQVPFRRLNICITVLRCVSESGIWNILLVSY